MDITCSSLYYVVLRVARFLLNNDFFEVETERPRHEPSVPGLDPMRLHHGITTHTDILWYGVVTAAVWRKSVGTQFVGKFSDASMASRGQELREGLFRGRRR